MKTFQRFNLAKYRAWAGATFLDEKDRGWFLRIGLEPVLFGGRHDGILGRLYPSYRRGLDWLNPPGVWSFGFVGIFFTRNLEKAWQHEIDARLNKWLHEGARNHAREIIRMRLIE